MKTENPTITDMVALPKVELHLHLDCSLSFDVVQKIDPTIDYETYKERFIAPEKCEDLKDYITRAEGQVDLMQTREELKMVVHDLFDQLKSENVIYAEIRFAPLQHLKKGLTPGEVVDAVNDAVGEGIEKTGIQVGVILSTLRHYTEEQSMETVSLVWQFRDTHVVGFDIAADEKGFPIDEHIKAFDFANEKGLNITAHAGEAQGPESVWETLEYFKPKRIGHGVRSVEDNALVEHLSQNRIHLEICPTSNVQTDVVDEMKNHPVDYIYHHGISCSINTDARTISNVTLTREYQNLVENFDWTIAELKKCNLEAVEHAFTSPETKAVLQEKIHTAYTGG